MLHKLTLTNFQKHRKFDLRFDPGVTTIVGLSDRGKTAVLRALRWVTRNEPSGTAFLRHGADAVDVALKVDGRWVVRHRDAGENTYQLDKEVYHSLRAPTVPQAIEDLLNLGEVNFQGQHDPPFWLTASAGQVSRDLNAVVNLGEMDAALAAASSDVSSSKAEVKVTEDRLAQATSRRDETAWLLEVDAELTQLEVLYAEYEELGDWLEEANFTVSALGVNSEKLRRWEDLLESAQTCLDIASDITHNCSQEFVLGQIYSDLVRAERVLGRDPLPEWEGVVAVRAEGDRAADDRSRLDVLIYEAETWQDRLEEVGGRLEVLEAEWTSAVGEVCPLCGKPNRS